MARSGRLDATILALVASFGVPETGAQPIERGRATYHGICIACHGFPPAGGPETVQGDATRIVAAFDKRPPMSSLRGVLSPEDVSDVAEYLLSLDAPAPAIPAHDASDLWWNSTEPGWGLGLNQHASGNVFGVLYVYDTEKRPAWFPIPGGRWITPTTFVGRLYTTSGPAYQGPGFDPAQVSSRQVGAMRITFTDRERATLVYTIDQRLFTKGITRQPF